MGTSDNSKTTVDLYVSAGASTVWNRQQAVVEEFERLASEGVIDRVRTQVWGQTVPVSGPMADATFHRAAVEAVEGFEQWARDHDGTVELPFERESVTSMLTDEEYHILRPPAVCAALYDDKELTAVVPCRVGGEQCTVTDLVSDLDAGEETAWTAAMAAGQPE